MKERNDLRSIFISRHAPNDGGIDIEEACPVNNVLKNLVSGLPDSVFWVGSIGMLVEFPGSEEPIGGVALWVHIHNQHTLFMKQRQAGAKINHIGGFSDAALEIKKGNDYHVNVGLLSRSISSAESQVSYS